MEKSAPPGTGPGSLTDSLATAVPMAPTEPASQADDPTAPPVGAPRPVGTSSARRDFGLLWTGQSLSLIGDQFMLVGLPVLAVTTLGVSAAQAALLPFALKVPFLLLGLPAGPVLDRVRRRPALIACDVVQMLSCLLIAALAFADRLPFWLLMTLVGINGCATVFFQIAYTSYLPSLFSDPRALHRGNSQLMLSESVSRSVGPMVAGPVIAAVTPAGAVLANSGSFLLSVLTLLGIRHREPVPAASAHERGWLLREMREGLTFVFRHPLLEPVLMCGGVYVLFQSMVHAIIVLYCVEVLDLSVAVVGLVVGAAALGYPIGTLVSGRLVDRLGPVRTIVLGATVSVTGFAVMAFTGAAGSVAGLVVGSIVHGTGEGSFGPTWMTLRQIVTPQRLLGRVNSVERFLLWGAVPLGSLFAALSIGTFGLSGAMWIGALGTALCLPPLLRRGILRGLRKPEPLSVSTLD